MPGAVVLTASAGAFPGLVEALGALSVPVTELPLMAFAPPLEWDPVDAALRELDRYEAVVFTSPRSARAFRERMAEIRCRAATATAAAHPTVWAAGGGTERALRGLFGPARLPGEGLMAERGAGAALADAMVAAGVRGPVLFPCGDHRREELPSRLRELGIEVEEVVCYRSVLATEAAAREAAASAAVLLVASPSVAELLARACSRQGRPMLVAVGPTTAAAAEMHGWPPAAIALAPTAEALAAEIRALLAPR
jgi:uroporphyrinogen-III synthase